MSTNALLLVERKRKANAGGLALGFERCGTPAKSSKRDSSTYLPQVAEIINCLCKIIGHRGGEI